MFIHISMLVALLAGGVFLVSYIRGLRDDYSYTYQDVNRFIDSH